MPAIYAHDRFGRNVRERMDCETGKIIRKYPAQFAIGLQGPDIFFFYKLHTNNPVVRYGERLHEISALPFFAHAQKVIRSKGKDSREYAYLTGFLCHFILDSECHSYVDEMIGRTGVAHLEIEEEFEKYLLRMDGKDPVAYPIGELVPTDRITAEAIAPFYNRKIGAERILRSLKDMKLIKKIFTAPQPWKQKVINSMMKMTGMDKTMKGVMNQLTDNPACTESNEGLFRRYQAAIDLAVKMIRSFEESLETGGTLEGRFDRTFE